MFTETSFKEFKRSVDAVLKNSNPCLVCIQNIDTNVLSFANQCYFKVSWGKKTITLYVPEQITFQIPYVEIREFHNYTDKQIEIHLKGRILVSIKEAQ